MKFEEKNMKEGANYRRSFSIETRNVDEEARTVELAFSSEEPYQRFFGIEVLDHDERSIRLDRLNGGGALLVEHDTRDQVGVVESARIDSDRRGRAVVRFSRSSRGQEIFDDVQDGIRTLVSVGYIVHKFEESKSGDTEEYRAVDWEPFEVSLVSVPADATVGVGRSKQSEPKEIEMTTETTKEVIEKPAIEKPEPKFDRAAEANKVRTEELKRINQISEMAGEHGFDELGQKAISDGTSVEVFHKDLLQEIGKRNNTVRTEKSTEVDLGLSQKDRNQFSMIRMMDALARPQDPAAQRAAAFEIEVCNEAENQMGGEFQARGRFIPPELLTRDLTAGTATDGAELVADNLLAGSYIDVLRNNMVVLASGARMLPGLVGNVEIPRQTSATASTWISAEDGDATESEPQFDQVTLSPKDLAAYTEVSRRLLLQSTPAIEGIVRNDLAVAQALGIDSAALYGSGSSGQPTGVANTSGINTFNFAAAAPTYAETVRMVKEVMTDNALMGTLGYIYDPAGWEDAATTEKAANTAQFILSPNGTINGYAARVSTQVTAEDWFFGNWSDLLIGEWGGLEINVDPYTHSLKGKIRYVTFKTVDLAVRHPVSFIHCNDGA